MRCGRIEIQYKGGNNIYESAGEWGTVCVDGWDSNEAEVRERARARARARAKVRTADFDKLHRWRAHKW